MERFEEALEALDARVKIPERGYSTQYDKLCEMCRNIDLIEQELGIPLEVLFKALKEGFYYKSKTPDGIFKNPQIDTTIGYQHGEYFIGYYTWWLVKDYGVTWALTREELNG